MASRMMQQSVRRLAVAKPSSIATSRFLVPTTAFMQTRLATIAHNSAAQLPQKESLTILEQQRLNRPVAPHLGIYKPQITWYLSMFNRLTGVALSGGMYLFAMAYLAGPALGWQITSAGMAAAFAKWPYIAQFLAKFTVGLPFWFHSFNGLRHLVWDTGRQITNMQVIRTGWTVVGLTVLGSLGFALFV